MRLGRALAGLVLVAGLAVAGSVPAGAVDGVEAGSWSDPARPGFRVASAPTGPTAVAAVRFRLADGESSPVLTLTVTSSTNPQSAPITACLTAAAWQATDGGSFADRPTPDCTAGVVPGTVDGNQVRFDLSTLARDDVVSVVLQVEAVSTGLPVGSVGPVADVTFAAPTAASVSTHASASPSEESAAAPEPEPSTADAGSAAFEPSTGSVFQAPVPDPLPATSYALAPLLAQEPASSPGAAGAAAAAPAPAAAARVTPAAGASGPRRNRTHDKRVRLLAAFVALDLGIIWWRLSWNGEDEPARRVVPSLR